jgi:hypothetical protein
MMMEIVPATELHARSLGRRLRPDDLNEVRIAYGGGEPIGDGVAMLSHGVRCSTWCSTAVVASRPVAMWGVVAGTALGGYGIPWMLGSMECSGLPFQMVRVGRREVARMLALYPRLVNYVAAEYTAAVRFIEVLGFAVGDTVTLDGGVVRRFERRR